MSGLFLLNLDSGDTHIHSIEAKRYKFNNDSATYLWHCRLGHIGVKRMKKLHADGLLESLDYESFDTFLVANICRSKQGLRIKRRLAKDEVTTRVGNGSKVDVIAVGMLPLHLPSGLVLDLNNCYLVPVLSMNIISGSCLM